jgi:alkylation response protein AidB-like acyl-CoA dehydrogenase
MDFNLTKEQIDIQKAAAEFAGGEFDPDLILEWDRKQEFPVTLWKKACDLGFVGAHFPEVYGGQGLEFLDQALILEAFCRRDSGVGIALGLSDFGSEMVLLHGKDAQKTEVLPALAHGTGFSTMAFLEDGYALSPFRTGVRKTGRGYFIHGMKSHVPLAGDARFMIVLCQADQEDPKGQTAFLLEDHHRDLEFRSEGERLGMRMIPVKRVFFNGLEVFEKDLIGEEGKGSLYLEDCLRFLRIEAGAMALGIAQGALDRALDYAGKREQFGKAIVSFNPVKNRLADMFIRVETARQMVYKAAWSLAQERPDERAAIMAKMLGATTALSVAGDAIQIYGGYGYMTEGQVEHFYRDAKALSLFLESRSVEEDRLGDLVPWKF